LALFKAAVPVNVNFLEQGAVFCGVVNPNTHFLPELLNRSFVLASLQALSNSRCPIAAATVSFAPSGSPQSKPHQ
jgi:hypothetical protein